MFVKLLDEQALLDVQKEGKHGPVLPQLCLVEWSRTEWQGLSSGAAVQMKPPMVVIVPPRRGRFGMTALVRACLTAVVVHHRRPLFRHRRGAISLRSVAATTFFSLILAESINMAVSPLRALVATALSHRHRHNDTTELILLRNRKVLLLKPSYGGTLMPSAKV